MIIEQLRIDFETVWSAWREYGQITPAEYTEGRRECGQAIRENMDDTDWIDCCASHFRALAAQIESDTARSRRIGEEVRMARRK